MENRLLDLVLKRRSIRKYRPSRIDDDVIDGIIEVGLAAPTSFGHRAVEFVVVRDSKTIRALGACKSYGGSQVEGADTVIVVMVKTADSRQSEFWIEDGAVASAYLLLAAEQFDIGACWVQIRNRMGQRRRSDEEIRALLCIPDGYAVLNLVALGEKGETKRTKTRADLHVEDVHRGFFGMKERHVQPGMPTGRD